MQFLALHLLFFALGVGHAGGSGRGQPLRDGAGGFGATDGRVGPYAVDLQEAAKGPDERGHDVNGGGDREEPRGYDGISLCFRFCAHHGVDELGFDLFWVLAEGLRVDEHHFFEADGLVRCVSFVHAIIAVFVGRVRFGAGDAVDEVEVRRGDFGHGEVDAFGGFAFDALPTCCLCVTCFRFADFFLPFALHFVEFVFFLAFGWCFERRRWGRVDQEALWDPGRVDAFDCWLGEWDKVCD